MIDPICIISHNDTAPSPLVEVAFQITDKNFKIYFKSDQNTLLSGNMEAFITSALLPCMKMGGGKISAKGNISPKFISALSVIQDIYTIWDASLHRTEVANITPVVTAALSQKRVGAFFTGGVDSFYTFLKHHDEITDLIFVHGLDIQLDDTVLRNKTSEMIRKVANEFGKNVIEIETNIRELLNFYLDWGKLGHGPALAAIGHLLSPTLHRIYIPSSYSYANLFPWGSHPILDPLWSSDSLEFIHDGCEATRVQKVALISKYDIAMNSLRVCWTNPDSIYNCGKCEKCIRTMINLKINNALSRCTTFNEKLDIKQIKKLVAHDVGTRAFIKENLDVLEKNQTDKELTNALKYVLNKPETPYLKRFRRKIRAAIKEWISDHKVTLPF
jgi:hypothetical protein